MRHKDDRITIELDPELKKEIKEYGAQPGVERPMSWLVREWIKEGLARAKDNPGHEARYPT